MNDSLLEQLLNEDEGSSLDFKLTQYAFDGATEDEKSELLKDVLTFSNAWRRTEAYILVGVQEVKGGRSIVRGVNDHLSDAHMQQFVSSKANRPIELSYEAFAVEGKQIGIIRIPVQARPFFLTKAYGHCQKEVVFVRRGSSTGIANPDEVAKMGAADVALVEVPSVELQFADANPRCGTGRSRLIVSTQLHLPDTSMIPSVQTGSSTADAISSLLKSLNTDFYREYATYLTAQLPLQPVTFVLKNSGRALLKSALLRLAIPRCTGLKVLTEECLPEKPIRSGYMVRPISRSWSDAGLAILGSPHLVTGAETIRVTIDFGDVQPKAESYSEPMYVGATQELVLVLEGEVFADNLPDPFRTSLYLTAEIEERSMSAEEFVRFVDESTGRS